MHSFAFVKNLSVSTAERRSDLDMWKPANEQKVTMMTVEGRVVLRTLILAETHLHRLPKVNCMKMKVCLIWPILCDSVSSCSVKM